MNIPILTNANYFHSDHSFPDIKKTLPRIVKEYEIEYIIADGDTTVIDNKYYEVKKDSLFVVKPGAIRYSFLSTPFQTAYLRIWVDVELDGILRSLPDLIDVLHKEQVFGLMKEIIENFHSRNRSELFLAGKLLLLFQLLQSDSQINVNTVYPYYPLVHQAKRYIDRNFNKHITSADIAAALNFSESHLRARFRAVYGITLHTYLTETRLNTAKQRLSNTTFSISQIAEQCGFSSLEYFINVFRKSMGCSPKEWRYHTASRYNQ